MNIRTKFLVPLAKSTSVVYRVKRYPSPSLVTVENFCCRSNGMGKALRVPRFCKRCDPAPGLNAWLIPRNTPLPTWFITHYFVNLVQTVWAQSREIHSPNIRPLKVTEGHRMWRASTDHLYYLLLVIHSNYWPSPFPSYRLRHKWRHISKIENFPKSHVFNVPLMGTVRIL